MTELWGRSTFVKWEVTRGFRAAEELTPDSSRFPHVTSPIAQCSSEETVYAFQITSEHSEHRLFVQSRHLIKIYKISIICIFFLPNLFQTQPSTRTLDYIPAPLRGGFAIILLFFSHWHLQLFSSRDYSIQLMNIYKNNSQWKKNPSIHPASLQTTILTLHFLHWQT